MTRKWRGIAVLTAIAAFAAVNAGQAFATETLYFLPQSGKFPIKKVAVKGSVMLFTEAGATSQRSCTSVTGEGEITNRRTAKLKLTLKGCGAINSLCHSKGAAEGEVVTGTLPVELVYTSKEHHEAALDINYEEPGTGTKQLISWECTSGLLGEIPGGVRGSILAPVTPVNSMVATHALSLKAKEERQTPSTYETETGSKFEAFPEVSLLAPETYAKGSMTGSLELTTSKEEGNVEIKA